MDHPKRTGSSSNIHFRVGELLVFGGVFIVSLVEYFLTPPKKKTTNMKPKNCPYAKKETPLQNHWFFEVPCLFLVLCTFLCVILVDISSCFIFLELLSSGLVIRSYVGFDGSRYGA